MASLQEIKTRLHSVKTTKKITKAMQLVATAKLRRAKNNLDGIQEYYHEVFTTFQDILASVKDFSKLLPLGAKDSTLYITINSDIGLAGAYNSNIFKLMRKNISAKDKIITIGQKGINFLNDDKRKILEFKDLGTHPDYIIASDISEKIMAMFWAGEISKVKIIYTEFINSVTYVPKIEQILPFDETIEREKNSAFDNVEYEPSPESVLKSALPIYVSAVIYGALMESVVSEQSSRRTAMENATDNADDLIGQLNLIYNRARQASITQEISEIVAGAEAE